MGTDERKYFALHCPRCGATGKAEWGENDGWAYLRDTREHRYLSLGFTRVKPDPVLKGQAMFHGRLVCSDCGTAAEIVSVNGTQYHNIKVPGMREV
jgi:hypothetical protein